jgi:hypothetical protein
MLIALSGLLAVLAMVLARGGVPPWRRQLPEEPR